VKTVPDPVKFPEQENFDEISENFQEFPPEVSPAEVRHIILEQTYFL